MRLNTSILSIAIVLLTFSGSAYSQEVTVNGVDPIEQLQLTPEQRQKIRTIFEENKAERQQTNRNLREANANLDQALDTEPANQGLIEQRINEVTSAHSAQLRMRIQTELKIRRELRPEQLARLRQLRLQMRDFVNAQRPLGQRPAIQRLRRNRQRDGFVPRPQP